MMKRYFAAIGLVAISAVNQSIAQSSDAAKGGVAQITKHMGEMSAEMTSGLPIEDSLRFEPYQMIDEMFTRNDIVFLMRHGPTDWSKLDVKDVAPSDCDNQRIMRAPGIQAMRNMGSLMAANEVLPGKIITSQWCRNQQTLAALLSGIDDVDSSLRENIELETTPDTNLLLSLQGAKDLDRMRETIAAWDGSENGPLLIITHFTNIEELTNFTVFEGEILMIDPKRENRVLGYLRLRSAGPDVGHFNVQ